MQVGEVRSAENSDFDRLRRLASEDKTEGCDWTLAAKKSHCSVYTSQNDACYFKMVKIVVEKMDVAAATVYNALHDAKYRRVWDKNMIESKEICVIDAENDIGYYQVKTPAPLRNRDFVTQRSWRHMDGLYMIMNHSVCHKNEQPRKNIIRGISYYTGYVIEPINEGSCRFTYISQSNPGGNLPVWLVNKLLTVVAPKVIQKMVKACKGYESWKKKNEPEYMPWLWPDQITADFIDWDDVEGSPGQVDDISSCSEEAADLKNGDVTDDIIKEDGADE